MKQIPQWHICATYHFTTLNAENLTEYKESLSLEAKKLGLRGLMILATEGFNSTFAAPSNETLEAFKKLLCQTFKVQDLECKHSFAEQAPFRKFQIKIRPEICTIGRPDQLVTNQDNFHLTPSQWNDVMKKEKDWVMVDTRNWYEYKIGTFKGALNPKIDQFTDFFDQVDKLELPKDKKMMIFCTGGIRCHKGIHEMQNRGYKNVYQLKGGILKYLEEYPQDQFEGECFVFDHRVAVDQKLEPSKKFGLCPHCGQPAERTICCSRCDFETQVCEDCLHLAFKKETCSKNCAYQFEKHPGRKAKHQFRPTDNLIDNT